MARQRGKSSKRLWKILMWLFLLFCFAVIFAVGTWYYYVRIKPHGDLKGITVSSSRYPVKGIDVSHYTGRVDFEKMSEHGVRFAYLRSSYGRKKDRHFKRNIRNAKAAGIPSGAYHYLRFDVDAVDQAELFIRQLQNGATGLPPVLDVEDWGNPPLYGRSHVRDQILNFTSLVQNKTGRVVMIYTNESGYRKYIEGHFDHLPLWICSFNNPPRVNGIWTFWQHSHSGRLSGADGVVDYNVFNGDERKWQQFIRSRS